MPIDHHAIAALAAMQHGAWSLAQARAAGATSRSIDTALRSGRWVRATRGVYLLAGFEPSPAQRAMVATLARTDAVVGGLSVAELAGWVSSAPSLPLLLVPQGTSARLPIARLRRTLVLPDDRTHLGPIPVTTAARTLVDLARELGPARLAKVVDAALHARATSPDAVRAQLERTPQIPGVRADALLAALEPWDATIRPGSPAEARLIRQIVAWGHPEPERQIRICDEHGDVVGRADGGWPDVRIAFEYDSSEFHGPSRWADDEARHAEIERLGWQLLHADAADLRPGERSFRDALAAAWATARERSAPAT